MDISERILRIEKIMKELKQLSCQASPIKKDLYFLPLTKLYAEVGQAVIEADRIGNSDEQNIDAMVTGWISDFRWEGHL